jgi:predicted phosphodiesterase
LRYLILSDIHANLEALTKCMELAEGKYDQVLCLGDVVGYGPDPNAVITSIRPIARTIIRGNHDKACCGITDAEDFNILARLATLWTRGELTAENLAFLRTLPTGPVTMNGFEMVHGSPIDEDEYIFGPGQALPTLRSLTLQVVFFGHTHFQGGFMLTPAGRFQSIRCSSKEDGMTYVLPFENGARYLVNPGSVGQPRDGDWRAGFAILDEDQRLVEYYRTPYELPVTQAKMHKARLPEPLIRRLELGR